MEPRKDNTPVGEAVLEQVASLLQRHSSAEDFVRRQDAPRQELVEGLINKLHLVELLILRFPPPAGLRRSQVVRRSSVDAAASGQLVSRPGGGQEHLLFRPSRRRRGHRRLA